MARRVLVQAAAGQFDLIEVPAANELELQEIVKRNPQLIPSDDLGLDGDLLVVGRETNLASGAIDLLCLARSGDLVLIEFKTGPQNPDFRAALAQLIDYGSDLWGMSLTDFDDGVVQRYLTGRFVTKSFKGAHSLVEAIDRTSWNLGEEGLELLNSRLADVLASGDFRFVVAAQRFTPAMLKSLDYLNASTRSGRYYLVQVIRLVSDGLSAYSAQVVSRPTQASRPSNAAGRTSESEFLAQVPDDRYREALREILSAATSLGLVLYWGAKGASIRIRTPDRHEPLSIGWVFLSPDQWYGARHLSFGVDRASLSGTPAAAPAVEVFVDQVSKIDGCKEVPSGLSAYSFEPETVPEAKVAIVAALERLAESVRALDEGDRSPSEMRDL